MLKQTSTGVKVDTISNQSSLSCSNSLLYGVSCGGSSGGGGPRAQVLDQVAGAQVMVDQVTGAQVLDQVAGAQVVVNQVTIAQMLDQVAGAQVMVDQVTGAQVLDQVAGAQVVVNQVTRAPHVVGQWPELR